MANTNYDPSIDATKGPKEYNTVLPFLSSPVQQGEPTPPAPSFLPSHYHTFDSASSSWWQDGSFWAVLDEKLLQCTADNCGDATVCSSIVWFHSNPASMAPGSLYVVAGTAAGGSCGCCGVGGGATRALGMSIKCSLIYSFNSNVRF